MAEKSWLGPLLGTVVGGLIAIGGSLGVFVLTQQEAEDAETKRATGAARLLADSLRRGEDVMAASLLDCRYRLYDVELTLPHDDLVLLAWRLEAEEWETVAQAMARVSLQAARSREGRLPGHEFEEYDVTQLRSVIGRIDNARRALEDVSGMAPYEEEKVEEEQALGADC